MIKSLSLNISGSSLNCYEIPTITFFEKADYHRNILAVALSLYIGGDTSDQCSIPIAIILKKLNIAGTILLWICR